MKTLSKILVSGLLSILIASQAFALGYVDFPDMDAGKNVALDVAAVSPGVPAVYHAIGDTAGGQVASGLYPYWELGDSSGRSGPLVFFGVLPEDATNFTSVDVKVEMFVSGTPSGTACLMIGVQGEGTATGLTINSVNLGTLSSTLALGYTFTKTISIVGMGIGAGDPLRVTIQRQGNNGSCTDTSTNTVYLYYVKVIYS